MMRIDLLALFITLIVSSSSVSSTSNSSSSTPEYSLDTLKEIFTKSLMSTYSYGTSANNNATKYGSLVTYDAIASMLQHDWSSLSSKVSSGCLGNSSMTLDLDNAARCIVSNGKCLSLAEVGSLYSLDKGSSLTHEQTDALSPALLYHVVSCKQIREDDHSKKMEPPSSGASWSYSFLFVTIINLCSMTGALVLPCMKLNLYKVVLMFLVALAVGTLAGSGLLFLIPEAMELGHSGEGGNIYIWKLTTVMGGIYLFFLLEKLLRSINEKRENTRMKKRQDKLATEGQITSSFTRRPIDNAVPVKDLGGGLRTGEESDGYKNMMASPFSITVRDDSIPSPGDNDQTTTQTIGNSYPTTSEEGLQNNGSKAIGNGNHVHHPVPNSVKAEAQEVAPVAYMIIFGDALHNFIDGLSIGAAFTQSILTGISISVAVMCEELPHELGDFAILLNSGMRVRKALCYNFLSACTCYIGTAFGILLGENTESHAWIFALAGGMFLYISLVDMLPEMNAAADSPEGKRLGSTRVFIIHNLGLLTGYGIMLFFALYGDIISFE